MTLKEEMLAFLTEGFGGDPELDFDKEEAIYWFASDWHGGQWSELYSVLSTSEFHPSVFDNHVGEMAREMYATLEESGLFLR